jgi:hypothetical protein
MLRKWVRGIHGRRFAVALALVAGNLLLVAFLWSMRGRSPSIDSGDLAAMFFTLGQYILLAAWCAWGTGRATTRWLVAAVSVAAVTVTFSHFATRSLGRYSDAFFAIAVCGAILLAGWYALFLPFRWLLSWQLTLDESAPGGLRGQFRLRHWLVWTAALGVPLALARLLHGGDGLIELLFVCVVLGLVALPFVVIYFRTAFSRRPWLWSAAALAFAVLVGIAEESLVVYGSMNGGASLPWSFRWMLIQQFCGMNLGLAAGLLGNLLMLRLMGMRFASGRKVPSADALASAGPRD